MLYDFLQEWFTESPWMTVHTSGSTGKPKKIRISKDKMMQSARLTCEFLNLQIGDTALLCMNLRYIGAMMVVVRSLVAGLNSDYTSRFRSSVSGYETAFEICGNGSSASL